MADIKSVALPFSPVEDEVRQGIELLFFAYRDFVGFEVSKPLLERSFQHTYGLDLNDVFATLDLAIGTYRKTVSGQIPKMTQVAWEMKKDVREGAIDVVIAQSEPGGTYYKSKETTVNLTADPERYQQMLTDGFTRSSSIAVRPTAYRLHVVVSDVASRAVGSLVIPLQR